MSEDRPRCEALYKNGKRCVVRTVVKLHADCDRLVCFQHSIVAAERLRFAPAALAPVEGE